MTGVGTERTQIELDADADRQKTKGAEKMKRLYIVAAIALLVVGCGSGGDWQCVERGKTMLSMSDSGKLGSADKGCTCAEIREFEQRVFGEVDEAALKSDFGC